MLIPRFDPFLMEVDEFGKRYVGSSKRRHIQLKNKILRKRNKK